MMQADIATTFAMVGIHAIYTVLPLPKLHKSKQILSSLTLSVKITRVTTSHSLLALGRRRRLIRLVRLISTLRRRRRLLLRWRRSAVVGHRRLLC